jgi:hypothetical protein
MRTHGAGAALSPPGTPPCSRGALGGRAVGCAPRRSRKQRSCSGWRSAQRGRRTGTWRVPAQALSCALHDHPGAARPLHAWLQTCVCSLGARPDLPKLLTGVLVTPRTRTVTHHGAKIACHLLLGCTAQWAHFVSRGSPECARLAQGSCHSASSALERSGAHTALKQFRQGGRWRAHTLSSAHPRGKPLYPMPSMILSGPTMQAPTYTRAVSSAAAWWRPKQSKLARQRTCLLGSLDRRALRNATAIK